MRLRVRKYHSLGGVVTIILTAEISGFPDYCFRIKDILPYLALLTVYSGRRQVYK
jgi:hypothetical protein